MKIKMLKDAGPHKAGETVEMPDHVAHGWISMGIAVQEKSQSGKNHVVETASITPPENEMLPGPAPRMKSGSPAKSPKSRT